MPVSIAVGSDQRLMRSINARSTEPLNDVIAVACRDGRTGEEWIIIHEVPKTSGMTPAIPQGPPFPEGWDVIHYSRLR